MLPQNISKAQNPAEVPGATQRGSLGRTGYSGPAIANEQYEFVLWALRVDKLPGTNGKTTAEILSNLLPTQKIETSAPFVAAKNVPGAR